LAQARPKAPAAFAALAMMLVLLTGVAIAASIGQGVRASPSCDAAETCAVTSADSVLLQRGTRVVQSIVQTDGSCDPFTAWPHVDNGVTCSQCTALVLTHPYGGRCDRYCGSFGHVCVAAAEERGETCQVLREHSCDEEIRGTSDMLCTCKRDDSLPPGTSTCFGELAGLAIDEGAGIGEVDTGSATVCQDACAGNDHCQSISFSHHWGCFLKSKSFIGGEAARKKGDFKTYYKTSCQAPPVPVPAPADVCYGELPALAVDEGESIYDYDVYTHSATACQEGCTEVDQCQSISFSPLWGCFLKTKRFTGGEATRTHADFKTYYKMPCAPTTPEATTTTPVSTTPVSGTAIIKVVSYNIYWWNAFGQNRWKSDYIIDNIKERLEPDVLGLQECDDAYLMQGRTGYLPASPFAGAQGVMVNPSLFTVGDSGSRDIEATGKWGARYVTWAQLTHKSSGGMFWHFNTHWCVHNGNGQTCGPEKRYVGAQNMLNIIHEKAGSAPVIITGDFNAGLGEQGMQHFLQNGFSLAVNHWVDAIFYTTAHWQKGSTGTGSAAHSDHKPVIAELKLR